MSKAILEFDLHDFGDREHYELCNRAEDMKSALEQIREQVFRPARKHGYPLGGIMDIRNWSQETFKVVSTLEAMFSELMDERGIRDV